MSLFKKAERRKVKIRVNISAPTGFGKTASALIMAYGITGDWSKIGVIDTENKSAALYAKHTLPNGFYIGEFETCEIEPPFTPEKYMNAIKEAEQVFEVLIIDSVTHVWQGQGGLLEYNDSLGGNKFQNWAKTTPRYQAWLNSILHSKCHIITTTRKKQAYEMTKDGSGKAVVEKKGMEDQIRDGYDYECTLAFELINDAHLAKASKDRTSLFMNKPEFIITPDTGKAIRDWCESGVEPVPPVNPAAEAIAEMYLAADTAALQATWQKYKQFQKVPEFVAAKDAMKEKMATITT